MATEAEEIDTQVAGENPEENQNPKDNDTHPQDEEQTLDTDGTKNLTAQSLSSRKSSTGSACEDVPTTKSTPTSKSTVTPPHSRRSSGSQPTTPRRNSFSTTSKSPSGKKADPPLQKQLSTPESKPQKLTTTPESRPESVASSSSGKKHVQRPGIKWKAGSKVEAMDYLKKWYPAKIVEVDQEEEEVLIHFEGWNQRFDEWLSMSSEKLRPATRHSDRKDGSKKFKPKSHKEGDNVLARWLDCRLYPAKVVAVNNDGSYEVLFYDGIKKIVQDINIRPMPPDQKVDFQIAPPKTVQDLVTPTLSKEERRKKMKIKKRDIESPEKKFTSPPKRDSSTEKKETTPKSDSKVDKHEKKEKSEKGTSKAPKDKKGLLKTSESVKLKDKKDQSKPKSTSPKTKPELAKLLKKRKLVIGGVFQAKRSKLEEKHRLKRIENKEKLKRLEKKKMLKQKLKKKMMGSPERKALIQKRVESETKKKQKSAEGVSQPSTSADANADIPTPPFSPHAASFSPHAKVKPAMFSENSKTSTKLDTQPSKDTPPDTPKEEKKKKKLSKDGQREGEGKKKAKKRRLRSDESTDSLARKLKKKFYEDIYVPEEEDHAPKEFKILEDHNPYKCIHSDCDKAFRKQSLLDYHIKYYHTEDGRVIQPPPSRQRRKTISICSTSSEISVGDPSEIMPPGNRPKKKRMQSGSSLPESLNPLVDGAEVEDIHDDLLELPVEGMSSAASEHTESQADSKSVRSHEDVMDLVAEDDIQEEQEGNKDEVVNCICQINEENGLMIQCDVCLCWQHAACLELTENTLPSKYVCYICQNPPGVRESARFMYDQDWFRTGEMARFQFLGSEDKGRNSPNVLATHNLLGDIHNINLSLNSLKRKINILKTPDHPDLYLWTKDWDVYKPEPNETADAEVAMEMTENIPSVDGESNKKDDVTAVDSSENVAASDYSDVSSTAKNNVSLELNTEENTNSKNMCNPDSMLSNRQRVGIDMEKQSDSNEPTNEKGTCNSTLLCELTTGSLNTVNVEKTSHERDVQISAEDRSEDSQTSGNSRLSITKELEITVGEDSQHSHSGSPHGVGSSLQHLQSSTPPPSSLSTPSTSSHDPLHNYKLSPVPTRVRLTGNSVWTPVCKNLSSPDKEIIDIVTPDPSEQSLNLGEDPGDEEEILHNSCLQNLKNHVIRTQDQIDVNLDLIEEQIGALEANIDGANPSTSDPLADMAVLKKQLHSLLYDLTKVKRMALYH